MVCFAIDANRIETNKPRTMLGPGFFVGGLGLVGRSLNPALRRDACLRRHSPRQAFLAFLCVTTLCFGAARAALCLGRRGLCFGLTTTCLTGFFGW